MCGRSIRTACIGAALLTCVCPLEIRPLGASAATQEPATRRERHQKRASATASAKRPGVAADTRVRVAHGKLPLTFEANRGQVDEQVRFLARGRGYSLFLTSANATRLLRHGSRARREGSDAGRRGPAKPDLEPPVKADGSGLQFSTYLGGNNPDDGFGIFGDGTQAVVTGQTCSNNFPTTPNVYQGARKGGCDAFVTGVNALGVFYSTYLGGSGAEFGRGSPAAGR